MIYGWMSMKEVGSHCILGGCPLLRGFVSMIHGWVFRAETIIVHYLGMGVPDIWVGA